MIRYTTIKYGGCCGQPEREYQVPDNITPHELTLLIPGLSLEDAVDLLSRRVEPDPSCNSFSSQLIQRQVRKECLPPAQGSLVTITIPAGRFTSQLSQLDADQQAEAEFARIAQTTANQLGQCVVADCVGCTAFRVIRVTACGEYRRDTRCVNGQCVDTSQEYFVCTGQCQGESCVEPCTLCSALCPTGACPQGYSCVNGSCKINCENAQCSLDCPQGSCSDPCTECRDGRCQPKVCPSNKICQNGQCIDRPCNPECSERIITPGPNDCIQRSIVQSCQSGQCVDTTEERVVNIREGASCGTNSFCRNGACTENPCINQGGSCAGGGVCCSGTFCFNGTCVTSCPQGYIQQGNTCVVDNGPNIIMNQRITQVSQGNEYLIGRPDFFQFTNSPCDTIRINGAGAAVSSNTSLFWQFRDLVISTQAGLVANQLTGVVTGNTCIGQTCYFIADPRSAAAVRTAFIWYLQNVVAPTQYVTGSGPTFGSLFDLRLADNTVTLGVCGSGQFTPPYMIARAKTSDSPVLTGSWVSNQSTAGSSQQVTVTLTISSSNLYNTPGYNPSPNTWSGFGFTTNWQNFNLQRSNPSGTFNLQGRIQGATLDVRNADNSPIFGTGDITNERIVGTFTVGTIVTKTLQ